jgi:GNAT superfamily N-acetyltransferase
MDSMRKILPVTQGSCRESAEVLGRAFADEPVSKAIYKGFTSEKRIKNLTTDFAAEMEVCVRRGCPLQISEDGKMVAAAAIFPPGAYPLPWVEQARITIKSIIGHDFYDIRPWWSWLAEIEKIHPHEPHFYFEYLGVLPEYQGKGYGTAIMQHITAQADEAHFPCYLETASTEAVPLYKRFGFEVIEEKEIIGVHTWFMWRQARER